MDRRKALKNMGLSLGYVVATPTLLSIVQSCKEENVLQWTPDFFTKEEGSVISQLADIILPKTDSPSATEVQVNLFIDRFTDQVMKKEQQEFFKMAMGKFISKSLTEADKDKANELNPNNLEPVLSSVLSVSKEVLKSNEEAITNYMKAVDNGETVTLDATVAQFAFASNLRGLTILGYKTSEYVGEKVLSYLPLPGEFIACGDVQELTGGKAWSL